MKVTIGNRYIVRGEDTEQDLPFSVGDTDSLQEAKDLCAEHVQKYQRDFLGGIILRIYVWDTEGKKYVWLCKKEEGKIVSYDPARELDFWSEERCYLRSKSM